jgi:hypothetical protein
VHEAGAGQDLLEARRRAETAEESLRQIRLESKVRLEEARQALAAEREARVAAERALQQARRVPRTSVPEEEPAEADLAHEPPEESLTEHHSPKPGEDGAARLRDSAPHVEGDDEGEWPTPWLEEPKRGMFRH